MKDLQSAIDQAIALLQDADNSELALFYLGENRWKVHAVSECEAVYLGETEGKYQADGTTALDAMINLVEELRRKRK